MWQSVINRQHRTETRTLFQDVSMLSSVQEEDESFDSPRRPATRSASRSALLYPARPYSPLPPLIIEVEKRVNKHDHPAEFYVRLEKKMKRVYRRLFIEGRNISSPMSFDEAEYSDDNDDNGSEERSNGKIDVDEEIDDGGNTEAIVISDRKLKRRTTDNESSESDEGEVRSKRSKSSDSSSAEVFPKSSYEEQFDDETIPSSIAEVAEDDGFDAEEENIEGTNYAQVDMDSFVEEEIIGQSYNVVRDETQSTSESLDHIQVTFQADVHRADEVNEPNDGSILPANVGDEMDDDSRRESANESDQDPESADVEVEESLEDNEVPGNNASTAPDRGDYVATRRIHPDDVGDVEPAAEEIGELLERDEGNDATLAADRGDTLRTPPIQPDGHHHDPAAGGHSSELLGNNRDPYNSLLAPAASEREVELMRTPLVRPSVGSLPEQQEDEDSSHVEQDIDFDFLNRTQDDTGEYEEIEERDASTQTSFEEARPDWGNIFYGQPKVFRLCDCRYHVCKSKC